VRAHKQKKKQAGYTPWQRLAPAAGGPARELAEPPVLLDAAAPTPAQLGIRAEGLNIPPGKYVLDHP
jgi:hypothetical protein